MNATGQMLSALLGWSQATFASELAIDGDTVSPAKSTAACRPSPSRCPPS
jgi:electron transfer flavoprotein alpha/beta subunit